MCSPAFQEQKKQICIIVVPLLVEEEGECGRKRTRQTRVHLNNVSVCVRGS